MFGFGGEADSDRIATAAEEKCGEVEDEFLATPM